MTQDIVNQPTVFTRHDGFRESGMGLAPYSLLVDL